MKQKDWILVLVMVFIAAVASLFVSNLLFASPKDRQQTAEAVDAITPDFPTPPNKYFNSDATNPTQPVSVGDSNNQNPFNSSSQ